MGAQLNAVPIEYDPLTDGAEAIAVALELERRSAFDAAYVASHRPPSGTAARRSPKGTVLGPV